MDYTNPEYTAGHAFTHHPFTRFIIDSILEREFTTRVNVLTGEKKNTVIKLLACLPSVFKPHVRSSLSGPENYLRSPVHYFTGGYNTTAGSAASVNRESKIRSRISSKLSLLQYNNYRYGHWAIMAGFIRVNF